VVFFANNDFTSLFSALSYLFKCMLDQQEKFENPYLAASEFRRISERFIPEIENSGLDVSSKHLKGLIGESYSPHFIDFVEKILRQLMGK